MATKSRLEKLIEVAEDLNTTMKLDPAIDTVVESAKDLKQSIKSEMELEGGQLFETDKQTLKDETWEYLTDTLGITPRKVTPANTAAQTKKAPNKKEEEKVAKAPVKKKAAAKKAPAGKAGKKKAAPAPAAVAKKAAPKASKERAASTSLDGKITILNKEPRFKEGSMRSRVFKLIKDDMTSKALMKKAEKLEITEAQMKGHIKKLLVVEAIEIK